ncbi:MAG TPA: PQQ-dependent sugar dehydrogenase [Nitrososphaeraceae archaeon]|nr:PQQ-dependent sugar dehydrogenase [Nitrososphaeraceae archaeon]
MSITEFLKLAFFLVLISNIIFTTPSLFGNAAAEPTLFDNELRMEEVFKGLEFPSNMAFLGPNDILVLEKDNGMVKRIENGVMFAKPLLDVNVANKKYERGLLGIASVKGNSSKPTYIFLYYTESATKDGSDNCPRNNYCYPGNEPLGNRLYRYELDNTNNKLINPKLLLDLPATPGPAHNGGIIVVGPDNNIYLVVGDILGYYNKNSSTTAQNFQNGSLADGRAGILRITQDGRTVGEGILGKDDPLDKYYAYGIRNSFGMDFDPLTGNLWDTENGPEYGDEINLVKPGFNSGWMVLQGLWKPIKVLGHPLRDFVSGGILIGNETVSLVNFNGRGEYAAPKFIWYTPAIPTAIKFLNSDKLGKQYENDMFVGDMYGNIYHFDLSKNRTELALYDVLHDKIANSFNEAEIVTFGKGFGGSLRGITDMEVGPDGYLYIVSYEGTIYRIVPARTS